MTRFWLRYIQPLLQTVRPARILEVGADRGWTTRSLLAFCRASGCRLDIVDPAPAPEFRDALAGYGEEYVYHAVRSIEAIPVLATPDVALIDGDHNWATVYEELNLLFMRAAETGVTPPIVLSHDVAWPYARRDMYYNPDELEGSQRHAYAYSGMLPGEPELVEEGLNGMFANALHEGGPRNGVLTAIEDFVAQWNGRVELHVLPFFNGLGILVPAARNTPALRSLIEGFFSAESLLQACRDLEVDAMRVRAALQAAEARLTRRTEALIRARALLAEQARRIEDLQARTANSDVLGTGPAISG